MECLLVHTIYIRTRSRLNELKQEFQTILKDCECKSTQFLDFFKYLFYTTRHVQDVKRYLMNNVHRYLGRISGSFAGADLTTVFTRRVSFGHGRYSHRYAAVSHSSVRRTSHIGIDGSSERRSFASSDTSVRIEVRMTIATFFHEFTFALVEWMFLKQARIIF